MKEGVIVGTPGEKQQQAKTTGAKMSYFCEFLKKKKMVLWLEGLENRKILYSHIWNDIILD